MTKIKILEAAINQYAMFGYHGATMQKIAAEVGIKPASIYFFYKNKETLFTAAFEKILEDHFLEIQHAFNEVQDEKVEIIFKKILNSTVNYHKQHIRHTHAYMSLITSPPPQIKAFLHAHMEKFDDWLNDSLIHILKRDNHLTDAQAHCIMRQFILLLDGIFWEINLYNDDILSEQIDHAVNIMRILLGGTQDAK